MGGHTSLGWRGGLNRKEYEDTFLGKGRVTVCIGCGGRYLTEKLPTLKEYLIQNYFIHRDMLSLKKERNRKQTKVTFRKIKHDIFLASKVSPQVISNEVLQFEKNNQM
jgi:hypothetical protein